MKKHVVVVVAAVMMVAGLVVATGGFASAHCSPSQYAGCFRTTTKVTATKRVPKGSRATICATVSVKSSTAKPQGTIQIGIQRRGTSQVVRDDLDYFGGKVCMVTRAYTKKGRYTVTAVYRSPDGSVFYDSSDRTRFKVTRSRR